MASHLRAKYLVSAATTMRRFAPRGVRGWLGAAALLLLALPACGGDDDATGDPPRDEPDGAPEGRDSAPADGAVPASLECDPNTAAPEELCSCMADVACDQIYFCLDGEELAAKPENWRPRSICIEALESDCLEDLGEPAYFPADFPRCVLDIAAASCADFGPFESVSQDFPTSCENLRALETGLGLEQ